MRNFLKNNIVLVLGVSLPLLLVIFFILAGTLPKFFVADPKYDFLFSDGKYGAVEFIVVKNQVNFRVASSRPTNETSMPHLYRYIAATGTVQEITFAPPDLSKQKISAPAYENGINANVVIPIDPAKPPSTDQIDNTSKIIERINKNSHERPMVIPVAELAAMKINHGLQAPDGYQFKKGGYGYYGSGALFMPHGPSRERDMILSKDGKNIPVMYNSASEGDYHSPNFIGWIIP